MSTQPPADLVIEQVEQIILSEGMQVVLEQSDLLNNRGPAVPVVSERSLLPITLTAG